ncbi:hypothetical protein EON64_05340, partial [archaeon]
MIASSMVLVQVLSAAAHPPRGDFSFFLSSLLDTVRINIGKQHDSCLVLPPLYFPLLLAPPSGECMSVSYEQMALSEASRLLMFRSEGEAGDFIAATFPHWDTSTGLV